MKSTRLFAAVAVLGPIWLALPLYAHAKDNSIAGGAQMYKSADAEVNDAGITSRIKTALAINPITKEATIHVDTDHGIVTLTSAVPNPSVMQEAQEIAQDVGHVKGVRNNLTVENVSNASFEM